MVGIFPQRIRVPVLNFWRRVCFDCFDTYIIAMQPWHLHWIHGNHGNHVVVVDRKSSVLRGSTSDEQFIPNTGSFKLKSDWEENAPVQMEEKSLVSIRLSPHFYFRMKQLLHLEPGIFSSFTYMHTFKSNLSLRSSIATPWLIIHMHIKWNLSEKKFSWKLQELKNKSRGKSYFLPCNHADQNISKCNPT